MLLGCGCGECLYNAICSLNPCNLDSDSDSDLDQELGNTLLKGRDGGFYRTNQHEIKNEIISPVAQLQAESDYFVKYNTHRVMGTTNSRNIVRLRSDSSGISLEESRSILTPRENKDEGFTTEPQSNADIRRSLKKYEFIINNEMDIDKKISLIKEYEGFKHIHDQSNEDDKTIAELYLQQARKSDSPLDDRIDNYQIALIYTNNLDSKSLIKREYFLMWDKRMILKKAIDEQ